MFKRKESSDEEDPKNKKDNLYKNLNKSYSDAQIESIIISRGYTKKNVKEVLEFLDPQFERDKIVENGENKYWFKDSRATQKDLKKEKGDLIQIRIYQLRKQCRQEYLVFRENPRVWTYLFHFHWYNMYNKHCVLRYIQTRKENGSIVQVKSKKIGRYVTLKGIIKRVSEVRHSTIASCFLCSLCAKKTSVYRRWYEKTRAPMCECMHKDKPLEQEEKRIYEIWQSLYVQDGGIYKLGLTENLEIRILDSRAFNNFNPGEIIYISGYIRTEQLDINSTGNYYMDALNITSESPKRDLTKSRIQTIKKEFGLEYPELVEKLSLNILPNIVKREELKESLLFQLASGGSGSKNRGIHVLMVGDPGTGKSEIMRTLKKNLDGIYTTASGCSPAGLTLSLNKDNKNQWGVEGGALPAANNSTLYLDEVDKIHADTLNALLEAMEQQTVSVSKAGINLTVETKTRILAASNPGTKTNTFSKDLSILDQIQLPLAFLSRFDLIIPLRDDKDILEDLCNIKVASDSTTLKLTQDYFKYCRTLKVEISKEVEKQFTELIKNIKQIFSGTRFVIGSRQVEGSLRLLEAHCRLKFLELPTRVEVDYIKEFLINHYKKLLTDHKLVSNEQQSTIDFSFLNKKQKKIIDYLLVLLSKPRTLNQLILKVSEHYPEITIKEITSCLIKAEKEGLIYSPKTNIYQIIAPLKTVQKIKEEAQDLQKKNKNKDPLDQEEKIK